MVVTPTSDKPRTGAVIRALRWVGNITAIFAVSFFILIQWGSALCGAFFFLPLSCFSAVLVGPVLIRDYARSPHKPLARLIRDAVARASAGMLLIMLFSLLLVNVFFWNGHVKLPELEIWFWGLALSVTAATLAAATVVVLLKRFSLQAAKWGSRSVMVIIFLVYRTVPQTWMSLWFGLIDDWGLTKMAFVWWLLFAVPASGALYFLNRRHVADS